MTVHRMQLIQEFAYTTGALLLLSLQPLFTLTTRGAVGSSSSSWAYPLILPPGTQVLGSFYDLNQTCFCFNSNSFLNSFLCKAKIHI